MRHNSRVADYSSQITELAELMNEFQLTKARLEVGEFSVTLRKTPRRIPKSASADDGPNEGDGLDSGVPVPEAAPVQKGTPVASPMTGIFYTSPSPGSPAFVKEGDQVMAGQIIGLIEAMKVFNEIPSPVSGTVLKVSAASGDLVQNGDVLLFIG